MNVIKKCPFCNRKLEVATTAPDYTFVIWKCEVHGLIRFDYSSNKWVLESKAYI